MTWRFKLARIGGNAITGYFAGLGTISITDADLATKLLQSLLGSAVLIGILLGRMVSDYGEGRKKTNSATT